jgi:DNA-binding XRE family transcriptional regulator
MQRLRIEEIAKAKGFNKVRLAREADLNGDTIDRLYKEPDYSPKLDTLRKVAKALGVSIGDLFEEVEGDGDDQVKKEE